MMQCVMSLVGPNGPLSEDVPLEDGGVVKERRGKNREKGAVILEKCIHDCHLVVPAVQFSHPVNEAHKLQPPSSQPEERSTKAMMKEVLDKLKDLTMEQQRQDKHQEKPTTPSWPTCTKQCQNVQELKRLDLENRPQPYAPQSNSMQVQRNSPSRWSGVIRDAILEGEWEAAAAITCAVGTDDANKVAEWRPHDWKILQQAKQTVTQHGLKPEAAKSILSWIFTADIMAPVDCPTLARLLLTPSEFLMWENNGTERHK
ncbi:hypothetical protein DUI87_22369 [Hirundo rustica rustica]|uniref:Uncharacterized protein n=1 Tax=Hirundo rustica rustica TaxID=333673 RepID=A0A3M0JJL9_HIRRU|nr:hypothetical protein DUI87_22369 [Hirundo rustica rustica]